MKRFGAVLAATLLSLLSPSVAFALAPPVSVSVVPWTAPHGHAYVGVQADGQWAAPGGTTTTKFCSQWDEKAHTAPDEWVYWVWVRRDSCSGTIVNLTNPAQIVLTGHQPGIGVRPSANGDMSLYLDVSVEPQAAPSGSPRTVSAHLTAGWIPALDNAILAYVVPSSVHVTGWTVKFGDGSSATPPPDVPDPFGMTTTHTYGPGQFDVTATAHVSGEAYGAFFAPDGTIYEQLVPFSIEITNSTSASTAAIEYIVPVVTVAASPSGALPDGTTIPADTVGHTQLYWPRGLHCSLYPRADIVREGYESSGGVVIGGATTVLTGYRYDAATNDAADATPTGHYRPDAPIAIQWDTPLSNAGSYPVTLTLDLQTTYADGTVRTSTASGTVGVTVIYSAVDQ